MTKTMFDPKVHGYKDGLWTCQHIQWPDHGVTQGEHPPIDPCPWCEIAQLRAALKVAQQSLLEFSHAQECGPSWYTRGESGMYSQVRLWLDRGLKAVKGALGPYDENGQFLKEKPGAEPSAPQPEPLPINRALVQALGYCVIPLPQGSVRIDNHSPDPVVVTVDRATVG